MLAVSLRRIVRGEDSIFIVIEVALAILALSFTYQKYLHLSIHVYSFPDTFIGIIIKII